MKVSANEAFKKGLYVFHCWGTYKGESVSEYYACKSGSLLLKRKFPRSQRMYASVAVGSPNVILEVIN